MFLFTVTRPGLRQAGALALCGVCLCGAVAAAAHFAGGAVTAAADAQPAIETTQDIGEWFTGHGLEVDLSTAAVDKVKIPKKWDDSFSAFNQVVEESGLTLENYKGKTVEKWTALCPTRSDGAQDSYAVLLVYKAQPIGAYLLEKPSGEVTGIVTAAKANADAALEQASADAEIEYPTECTAPRPDGRGVLFQDGEASPHRSGGMAKTAPHSSSAVGLVVR